MATLFKLVISAETTTNVSTNPDVERYFYSVDPAHRVGSTLEIPATAFVDDTDTPVTTITEAIAGNGYYLLFINGVLQQSDLYTISDTQVVITDAASIPDGAVITLVVTNFVPDADSTTTIIT
ncbi:DUF4183 domain-containing protein [Defluviitalea raffinosedens]|jgi:hypothetical protein|uniref:DUF4183 domain-containing protein n=1 Tax=Defluviitalea raffinosedens TaxID=1450156 RepID=A0A7C8LEY6_9FIRM|nr:DUF4183 domain-containing protein [Defluviitalea raffinosedens]KAE9634912.1 DUF4183 domain-containing protein [Defluviitalea raffinosedens]MBM7685702.1 hypothetical protein [Defluviitalea raffinosedens]MBZ4667459.1 hypothetical protein [Defluviitaleaceae bacterium]HHW66546.1 DUF4183 domain-containing protein [Candidatus Epulonipiscium sp.]